MAARILNGNAIARSIRADLAQRVERRVAKGLRVPGLAVLLVGDDPGSLIYVRLKQKDCQEVGFKTEVRHLAADTDEAAVFALIDQLNADTSFDGILVQLPLPSHIDALAVTEHVAAAKDVDGVHPHNMGRLVLREPSIHCCTARAVMTLLEQTGVEPRGLHATGWAPPTTWVGQSASNSYSSDALSPLYTASRVIRATTSPKPTSWCRPPARPG